jgi:hypothetical protein
VPPPARAPFQTVLTSGRIYEDAAHGLGRGGKEVAAAIPVLGLFDINQPQIDFMNQGGGLQGLSRFLLSQLLGRQFAQLVVDQRQKLVSGFRVALLDGVQNQSHVAHRSENNEFLRYGQAPKSPEA